MTVALERPVVCPIIVARDNHLAVLRQLHTNAAGGSGQTVLLSGEAGIGKSRLVAEARTFAAQSGARILQGVCFEPDRALLYAPVLDLFRSLFTERSPEDIAQDIGPAAPELVKLLPELTFYLPDLKPTPPLEPEQEKRRLYEALAQVFLRLAAKQPLLIVIEDVHWCDDTSLGFLLYLARRSLGRPLLLLLTYRSDEVHADLRHLLASLDRERLVTELALAPLDAHGIDQMLRAIFALDRPARTDFVEALRDLTEGNPFYIEETLKSLVNEGEIFYKNGGWDRKPTSELHIPRSLHDAVQRRVQQLSPDARSVLAVAAVAGQRFNFDLLQEVTEHDEGQLLTLVKELIGAQLVVEVSAEQYAFRHALTRQAIYTELLARERLALHRTLADAIERTYAATLDAHLADLSYHYSEAHNWEKTLVYAQRVGERSLALYAPRAAAEQLTRALNAAHRLGLTPPPSLYRGRGLANETLGDFEHARLDYEAALQVAEQAGDQHAQWQALLDLGLLWTERDYAMTGDYYNRAFELASAMDDLPARAESLNRLGNWRLNIDQPVEAVGLHHEALALFEELQSTLGIAQTLDLLGMTNFLRCDMVQGLTAFERAVTLEREIGERQLLSSSLATLSISAYPSFQTEMTVLMTPATRYSATAEEALQIACDIGHRAGEAFARFCLSCCLGASGAWGGALEMAQQALIIAEEIEHRQWGASTRWALGNITLDLLALSQARDHLEQGLALAQEIGSRHWIGCLAGGLARTCVAQGDLAYAQAVLDAVLRSDAPMLTMGQRLAWQARIELSLARDDPQMALRLVDAMIAAAPNADRDHRIPQLVRLRGRALAALGQFEAAEEELRAAVALAREERRRPLMWRCHLDLGNLYRSQRRLHEAEAEDALGRQVVEEIAKDGPAGDLRDGFVRQALALFPARVSTAPRRAVTEKYEGLTTREREIAGLIAQGKSNRAIATELVLSERTVESHVTNILLKLTFTSRTQIAAWAVQHGLTAPAESTGP